MTRTIETRQDKNCAESYEKTKMVETEFDSRIDV